MEDKELEFKSLDDMLDFLVADEQEAIDGYDAVLGQVEDEHVKEELIKLRTEEQAHKEFLETLKKDPTAVYVDPLTDNDEDEVEPVDEGLNESESKPFDDAIASVKAKGRDALVKSLKGEGLSDEDANAWANEVFATKEGLSSTDWKDLEWPEPTGDIE